METVSEHRCFGGVQGVYRHQSQHTNTPMQFSAFVPSAATGGKCPVLWFCLDQATPTVMINKLNKSIYIRIAVIKHRQTDVYTENIRQISVFPKTKNSSYSDKNHLKLKLTHHL